MSIKLSTKVYLISLYVVLIQYLPSCSYTTLQSIAVITFLVKLVTL